MNIEGIRGIGGGYTPALTQSSAVPAGSRASDETSPRSVVIPYLSPALRYDSDAGVAVLLFRDGNSGEVELQYPSRQVVREYQLRGRDTAAVKTEQSGEEGKPSNSLLTLARAGVSTLTGTTPTVAPSASATTGSSTAAPAASSAPASGAAGSSVNFIA